MWPSIRKWHRWLGMGLGWLMFIWFISGAVMMFISLPRSHTTAEGRAAHSPPLPADEINLGFRQAWEKCGRPGNLLDARLSMLAGRPAYFFLPKGGDYRVVWAYTGDLLDEITPELALLSAGRFIGHIGGLANIGMVHEDQWTVGTAGKAPFRPYYKFERNKPGHTAIYVSSKTGEVCQVTNSSDRLWAWMGAIPHWLYFTVLRSDITVWHWTIVILSAVGCLLCLTGLWLGIRFFRMGGWGRGKYNRSSPFLGWRKRHHYLGIIFGIPALTWTFSGMLSMNPFDWHTPTGPDSQMVRSFSGGPPSPEDCLLDPARALRAMGQSIEPRMLRLISFQGRPYYLCLAADGRSRLAPAWSEEAEVMKAVPKAKILHAAEGLVPRGRIVKAGLVGAGDLYLPGLGKPVWKIQYDDPQKTWLYLDPRYCRIIRRLDDSGRLNRWLYRFLHCFDLPWLARHRVVRDTIMLVLLAGGTVLSFSGPWSWLARRRKKAARERAAAQNDRNNSLEKNKHPSAPFWGLIGKPVKNRRGPAAVTGNEGRKRRKADATGASRARGRRDC